MFQSDDPAGHKLVLSFKQSCFAATNLCSCSQHISKMYKSSGHLVLALLLVQLSTRPVYTAPFGRSNHSQPIFRTKSPASFVALIAVSQANESSRQGIAVNGLTNPTAMPQDNRPVTAPPSNGNGTPGSAATISPALDTTVAPTTNNQVSTFKSITDTPYTTTEIPIDIGGPNSPSRSPGGPNSGVVTQSHSSYNQRNLQNYDLNVFLYSVFIVYISLVKLAYHNITFVKNNLTEPGILIIFGIIWEVVIRKLTNNPEVLPKFNSRIFFYLFLPSTVLESASILANKCIFLELIPILIHSIIGTLIYAASLGFTIYALTQGDILGINFKYKGPIIASALSSSQMMNLNTISLSINSSSMAQLESSLATNGNEYWQSQNLLQVAANERSTISANSLDGTLTSSTSAGVTAQAMSSVNLNLGDCLIFGTILSSIDASGLLNALRQHQVNEKLYYMVIGENMLNNAVVLVLSNLVLEFFNTQKLTVSKIYFAILQFFLNLFGAVFIGLSVASFALLSIRLSKRFQVVNLLSTSYQNQCQTMVETMLILKFAYFSYSLSALAGTSSILSLATYGILQDQYIKLCLNLRSQFTLRQVILASKTLGYTLVYPLIGMLIVDSIGPTQLFYDTWLSFEDSQTLAMTPTPATQSGSVASSTTTTTGGNANAAAALRLAHMANQANFYWNVKLLLLITILAIFYRFVVVIGLTFLSNLFAGEKFKLKFREQVLIAYGSLKGPLALALAHRLSDQQNYREQSSKSKQLLMINTILFICFISNIIKGPFIRPLVAKMQLTLCHSPISLATSSTYAVFNEISCLVTDHVSQGINNLLGHRKSPCDRFIEYNETHIKPWLAGRKAARNTNWLSMFYDNLTLDEIMNANCFHKAAREEADLMVSAGRSPAATISHTESVRVSQTGGGGQQAQLSLPKAISRPGRHLRTTFDQETGLRGNESLLAAAIEDPRKLEAAQNEILRELVLYNLKLEEMDRRRMSSFNKTSSRVGPTAAPGRVGEPTSPRPGMSNHQRQQQQLQPIRQPITGPIMPSSSSVDLNESGDSQATRPAPSRVTRAEAIRAIELSSRAEKRRYLMELEQYLSDTTTPELSLIGDPVERTTAIRLRKAKRGRRKPAAPDK